MSELGIEVRAQSVQAIVGAFVSLRYLVTSVLVDEHIGSFDATGAYQTAPDDWYPQEAWLLAFARIAATLGADALFEIGKRIPDNAEFPPWVIDIRSAIRSIDVAYHLNHRKNGVVMFSIETGAMLEGIGHYGYALGDQEIVCVCNTPYPCEFDRGIITAMARKFEPKGGVVHDASRPCRKLGANSCTYVVSW